MVIVVTIFVLVMERVKKQEAANSGTLVETEERESSSSSTVQLYPITSKSSMQLGIAALAWVTKGSRSQGKVMRQCGGKAGGSCSPKSVNVQVAALSALLQPGLAH